MKTILIVEDDDKIAEIEQDYLQANGFATERASDGRKGLSMALQGDYALILSISCCRGWMALPSARNCAARRRRPCSW